DVHVVTGVVKSYLREPTREPLCTFQNYESFLNAIGLKDWREKMSSIQDLVHALPRKNFVTLKYLCEHLKRVAASESENRMSIRNLSIIFAPNLLR
ncbi:Rho GTPase-activating protein domain-containing protein, partial [Zopfochytrium polystomum]